MIESRVYQKNDFKRLSINSAIEKEQIDWDSEQKD